MKPTEAKRKMPEETKRELPGNGHVLKKTKNTKYRNRKTFMAVIQINNKKRKLKATARVYRIKQNSPVLIGFLNSIRINTADNRDEDLVNFLKYNGHVLVCHSVGNEFKLAVV